MSYDFVTRKGGGYLRTRIDSGTKEVPVNHKRATINYIELNI